jgi:hypothetical protein
VFGGNEFAGTLQLTDGAEEMVSLTQSDLQNTLAETWLAPGELHEPEAQA